MREMRQARSKASSFNVQARNANAAKRNGQSFNGQCGIPFHSPGAVRRVLQNAKHQTPQAHERSRTDCHVSAHACHHVRDIRSLFTRRTERSSRALCGWDDASLRARLRDGANDASTIPLARVQDEAHLLLSCLAGLLGVHAHHKGLVGRPRCEEHSNVKTA